MFNFAEAMVTARGRSFSRPLGNRFSDVVSLKEFGASGDPDDTTDIKSVFDAAIAELIAYGQNVSGGLTRRPGLYVPSGVYRTSPLAVIKDTSRIKIRGDAMFSTKLRLFSSDIDAPVFQLGDFEVNPASAYDGGAQGFELSDMIITNDFQSSLSGASGQATSGGASTLSNSAAAMTVNAYVGCNLFIWRGTGAGQLRPVVSNTATTFTVSSPWTVQPDSTSEYITNFPARKQMGLQDNGCGSLQIDRVQFQGFKYGICLSYGSDFDSLNDVRIRNCDVGLYMGPGSQQHIHKNLDIGACKIGMVMDAVKHGKSIATTFTQNGTDIVIEATNSQPTSLGVTSSAAAIEKIYDNKFIFDTCWFETGAGESTIPVAEPHLAYVQYTGDGATSTGGIEFHDPIIFDGTSGMPSKVAGATYAFIDAFWAKTVTVLRPLISSTRMDRIVANNNTGTFPFLDVVDPVFVNNANVRVFSRPDTDRARLRYTRFAGNDPALTLGTDHIVLGQTQNFLKQTFTGTSRVFNWQVPNGVYLVVLRADKSDYTGGAMATYLVWVDKTSIRTIEQIGTTKSYGTGSPTLSAALSAGGVLQGTVTFGSSTAMVASVAMTTLQIPQTFP
ncbi:MAG: hypothetical protein ACK4SQ_14300 [Allorhizobium sp.]